MGLQWHQLDNMQINGTFHQTDKHSSTSSLNFYRPYALPDAQPTVSMHWRQSTLFCLKKEGYAYVTVTSIGPPNTRLVQVSKVN